jgi:hypothetical protein
VRGPVESVRRPEPVVPEHDPVDLAVPDRAERLAVLADREPRDVGPQRANRAAVTDDENPPARVGLGDLA